MIKLYPSIDLSTLRAISKDKEILIIDLYHSGTGQSFSKNGLIEFITYCSTTSHALKNNTDIKVFFGTFPSQYIKHPYESTMNLINAGGFVYKDLQSSYLYAFSILALANDFSPYSISKIMQKWELNV